MFGSASQVKSTDLTLCQGTLATTTRIHNEVANASHVITVVELINKVSSRQQIVYNLRHHCCLFPHDFHGQASNKQVVPVGDCV
ncbi:hypothetical protein J6590_028944 [Homalodisca vitripennis]|nr:hypothetical protein J6590_028944 [Homalodisca vitripennis]